MLHRILSFNDTPWKSIETAKRDVVVPSQQKDLESRRVYEDDRRGNRELLGRKMLGLVGWSLH
jgi:hypothetical protein